MQSFLAIIPAFIIRGISWPPASWPALGFAMLARSSRPKVAPYFLLGFLGWLHTSNVPVLGIALLGVIIVVSDVLVNDQNKPNNTVKLTEVLTMTSNNEKKLLTKSDINRLS